MQTYRLQRGLGFDGLERTALAPHALGPHDVRVGMRAVALNNRDISVARAGQVGDAPITPGSDGAGVVTEVGPAVSRWRVGDRVAASFFPNWIDGPAGNGKQLGALGGRGAGVLTASLVLPESAWFAIPAGMSFEEASTLPCAGVTAWNALFEAGAAKPGETVLLLGTGGVSIWALQLAKAAGLRVCITSSDNAKLALGRQLGADATINYREQPDWHLQVRELTGGRGADLVLETSGQATLRQSMAAVRSEGRVMVIGGTSGWGGEVDADALIDGALRLAGVLVGSRAMAEALVRFVEQRGLRPVIDRVFPFDQARAAYEHLAASGHVGKVVIQMEAGTARRGATVPKVTTG